MERAAVKATPFFPCSSTPISGNTVTMASVATIGKGLWSSAEGLHVAILTPGFAIDETDTNCVPALQDLLSGLAKRAPDIDLTVLALRYPHRRERYSWHGIDVYPANGRQLRFPAVMPSWARLVRRFALVNRLRPVAVIHSFWLGECALIGALLSRYYGLPHVVTLMGQEVDGRNRYARLLRSRTTTFVAVSEFQRRRLLIRHGRDVDHVIPWGVPELEAAENGRRDIDVLGVGSLTDVKDFDTFLDVVSLLRAQRPALTCRIAGDGPNRAQLERKAQRLGLEDTIAFEGRVSRERVFELMRRSRVLLHTSRFESYGLVFAEALACGARIVSREVGIAEPGPNWSVSDDSQEMAAAVSVLVDRSTAAKPPVHSIDDTVHAYRALYRIMDARRRAAALA
jgi:1,2-diacylglycerol 3-alpha-glucosyltransferase